jgi:hypothetical protein
MLDRGSATQTTYLRALVDARATGLANLAGAFADVFPSLPVAFRTWVVAQFLDNTNLSADPDYAFASWNFRSILTNQLGNMGYPLKPRAIPDGNTESFSMPGGGAGYLRFRVNASRSASIVPTTGEAALNASVELILIRTQ